MRSKHRAAAGFPVMRRNSDGGNGPSEETMFSLRGPEWSPTPDMGGVTSLSASNGSLFVGTANGMIVRLGVVSGEFEQLELPSSQVVCRVLLV